MGKLDGKIALVTGGNQGIGKGIALALASEGAALVLCARGAEALQRTAGELSARGVKVLAVPADLTQEQQVQQVFAKTLERFGRLDILFNNAGAFDGGPLDELAVETWDKVIAINLRAPFLCTREALRIMKKQGGGRIINIGSISAQRGFAWTNVELRGIAAGAVVRGDFTDNDVTIGDAERLIGDLLASAQAAEGNVLIERRRGTDKKEDQEPMMSVEELAETALSMATLPAHMNMLEAIVLPVGQLYVGRG